MKQRLPYELEIQYMGLFECLENDKYIYIFISIVMQFFFFLLEKQMPSVIRGRPDREMYCLLYLH